MNRVVGLETEYGCLTDNPAGPPSAIGRVRNWIFDHHRYGLADIHQRDWDEPAGNGGFLFNGGRTYVDMGHLEYCTPECRSLKDLILYDRAGDELVLRALKSMHLERDVSFIRNNVDHYSGATFGCHENYLVRRDAPLTESNVLSLLTFLTLRLLYVGAGKVGPSPEVELGGEDEFEGSPTHFQIGQRADYINNDLFEWVQFNRAIINTRDEPLADGTRFRRLHLLHGDTSVLPVSLALKVGTTALVLDLLETGRLPRLVLADAVVTFRRLSHQPDGDWIVTLSDGRRLPAVEVLMRYCEAAAEELGGRDEETDAIIRLWKSTLEALTTDRESLVGKVDWVTKRWLFEQFIREEGIDWRDPWLKSLDLEFHRVDPERNLALPLEQTPEPWRFDQQDIDRALTIPPQNTRAHARSELMHHLRKRSFRYFVDWEMVDVEGFQSLNLKDPFDPKPQCAVEWLNKLNGFSGPDHLSPAARARFRDDQDWRFLIS